MRLGGDMGPNMGTTINKNACATNGVKLTSASYYILFRALRVKQAEHGRLIVGTWYIIELPPWRPIVTTVGQDRSRAITTTSRPLHHGVTRAPVCASAPLRECDDAVSPWIIARSRRSFRRRQGNKQE
ncbi:hypothetical protein E2C01_029908 [Portunus trituberculatus]|uniref:Uncharacterized protein n=1 Tax=Portunus trituberculatus TaxID=210409 RepID=A0A5B7EP46_PORTR|nr:hypothetical protein [Portunus trituberculatus]